MENPIKRPDMNASDFKKPVLAWVAFFSTVCVLSVGYAAYVALLPVNSGDQLKKADWNTMVADLADFWAKLNPFSMNGSVVNIGVSSPILMVGIGDSANGGWVIVLNKQNASGNEGGEIQFAGGGATSSGFMIDNFGSAWSETLRIINGNNQGLFVSKTGNVWANVSSPLAALDVNGDFIRTIPRWQGYSNDQTDNGVLAGRTFAMTKRYASTGIKVTWSDNFRVVGLSTACSWEILFNGASCPSPWAVRFDKYEGGTSSNRHDPNTVFWTCFWLPAGTVTVTTKVSQKATHPGWDCVTGWDSALVSIEGEEVR